MCFLARKHESVEHDSIVQAHCSEYVMVLRNVMYIHNNSSLSIIHTYIQVPTLTLHSVCKQINAWNVMNLHVLDALCFYEHLSRRIIHFLCPKQLRKVQIYGIYYKVLWLSLKHADICPDKDWEAEEPTERIWGSDAVSPASPGNWHIYMIHWHTSAMHPLRNPLFFPFSSLVMWKT